GLLLPGDVGVVLDSGAEERFDLLLEIALPLTGPLDLAGQDQLAAGSLRPLDGQVLTLIGRDPSHFDQIALVVDARGGGRELDGVVHDPGQLQRRCTGRLADANGTKPGPAI